MKNYLELEFLGTGTSVGIPMIGCNCLVCSSKNYQDKRLRSSIKISSDKTTIVIDTTPDFRYQMLRSKTFNIDAILITHKHKDHLAGLDDIRPYNFLQNKTMPIYTNKETIKTIKNEYQYAFEKNSVTSIPSFYLREINKSHFRVNEIKIIPIKIWHHNLLILGFRINNLTYITDASRIDNEEKKKIIGSKFLIINALRIQPHIAHFSLQEAMDLALELGITNVYFTHISHQLGLHIEVEKILPNNFHLAYDTLKIQF